MKTLIKTILVSWRDISYNECSYYCDGLTIDVVVLVRTVLGDTRTNSGFVNTYTDRSVVNRTCDLYADMNATHGLKLCHQQ